MDHEKREHYQDDITLEIFLLKLFVENFGYI